MSFFLSYEGEGDLLGVKTLFTRYPFEEATHPLTVEDLRELGAVYVTSGVLDAKLSTWLRAVEAVAGPGTYYTIEVPHAEMDFGWGSLVKEELAERLRFFVVVENTNLPLPLFNGFVKVRVMDTFEMSAKIAIANKMAVGGHRVLLMPEFGTASALGDLMMQRFDAIHPRVRFMPPVQSLLGIR